MDIEYFENTEDFIDYLQEKYPGSRKDLLRLVNRVQMDTRNAISRTFGAMELEVRTLEAK